MKLLPGNIYTKSGGQIRDQFVPGVTKTEAGGGKPLEEQHSEGGENPVG